MIELTSDLDRMTRWAMSLSIKRLDLTVRAENVLWCAGVRTVGDLAVLTPREVLRMKNSGRKVYNEIKTVLADMGLELAGEGEG